MKPLLRLSSLPRITRLAILAMSRVIVSRIGKLTESEIKMIDVHSVYRPKGTVPFPLMGFRASLIARVDSSRISGMNVGVARAASVLITFA